MRLQTIIGRFFNIVFFLLVAATPALAQPNNNYESIDAELSKIKSDQEKNSSQIANYINQRYTEPRDKARAIYFWLASKVKYDMPNIEKGISFSHIDEIIDRTITKRTALCFGYAETYKALAEKCGLTVYVVSGYTRQLGKIDQLPHSWCVILLDNNWYGIDATWGAGAVINGKYKQVLNNSWFLKTPNEMIVSHMPFDPLWQLKSDPISYDEFYEGKTNGSKDFFSYNDTLKTYLNFNQEQQSFESIRRIQNNGTLNNLIKNELNNKKSLLSFKQQEKNVNQYNQIAQQYNAAIVQYNQCVDLANKQNKNTPEFKTKHQNLIEQLDKLSSALQKVQTSDQKIKQEIKRMSNSIIQLQNNTNKLTK